ncbi:MAG: bifunctional riboflavin kinase/FAD synthetase [Planctomycetota bacterium]
MAQLLRSMADLPEQFRMGAVAIGNFDGVHAGHRKLVAELVAQARNVGGPAVVLTFDPPPVAILVPDQLPTAPLTSLARRAELLGELDVDALVAYPTDRSLLNLGPEDFFQEKIHRQLGAKAMVEGPNFRFGKNRSGDISVLRALCENFGLKLSIVEAETDEGEMISSSRIRKALTEGDLASANQMLTQPYQLSGIVSKGARRGREIGFPTANLEDVPNLIPCLGVYAGQVQLQGKSLAAAIHIGPNPTFEELRSKVEVHIMDWDGTIYGERLQLRLLHRVRETQKFTSVQQLKTQLGQDIAKCRNLLGAS